MSEARKEVVSIQTVTPKIAGNLLTKNTGNRNLRNHRVEQYAKIMREGGWLLTGDAIVIAESGKLINGQHRLAAVEISGVDCPFVILHHADESVYAVMDSGSPRTTRDLFAHNGVSKYVNEKAAIARIAFAYISGKAPGLPMSSTDPQYPTSADCYQIYTEFKDEIDYAARMSSDCSSFGPKSQIGFALWLLATECGLEEAEEFAELVSPQNRSAMDGDFAPRMLRDHLIRLKLDGRKTSPRELAYKFATAFNAWMDGQPLPRLTWEDGRAFPKIAKSKTVAA